jgi:hypothetical protein
MIQIKIFSSLISETGARVVKFLRYGLNDVQTANQVGPAGIDSAPIKDLIAVYSPTTKTGNKVLIGYISKNSIAESGEIRFFSQNDQGAEQTFLYLKKDGTIEIGGNTDNAVRYSELKTAFDTLKADFNSLVTAYNAHVHITTATVGPTPVPGIIAPTVATGTPSSADITASKIDEIKVP